MKFIFALIAVLSMGLSASAADKGDCLRAMPLDELSHRASFIARVKVVKVRKANFQGRFKQTAELVPIDIIAGNPDIKLLRVFAQSTSYCAGDILKSKDELLIFLESYRGVFRIVNYQHGFFKIEGEQVLRWRDASKGTVDIGYADVRKLVESSLSHNTQAGK